MRTSSTLFALAAAGSVAAQFPSAITGLLSNLSTSCQQTVLQLATSSDLSSCLHIPQALPILTAALNQNGSLIPYIDQLVGIECGQPGCSNATLSAVVSSINSGCATDLAAYNATNTTVRSVVQLYPLAREIVCLKTSIPYNGTDAPIPINSTTYNTTNGANCVTSVLTAVSAKVHSNLSIPFFSSLYSSYMNGTIGRTVSTYNFTATDLCYDCIAASASLIGESYPRVLNVTLGQLGLVRANASAANATMMMNSTMSTNMTAYTANTTIEQAFDGTCVAQGFMLTSNGTLPATIKLGAVNSTYPYNVTAGAVNYTAPAQTTPIMRRRNVANIKARWIGDQF